jgi:hypothetical protein
MKELKMKKTVLNLSGVAIAATFTFGMQAMSATTNEAVLYKDPNCGCCENYTNYMRTSGFTVEVNNTSDVAQISLDAGIPENMQGCHLVVIGNYVISGHVPLEIVNKMLEEKPDVIGLTLPGMPMGAPGMGGPKEAPFEIYAIRDGQEPAVYAVD